MSSKLIKFYKGIALVKIHERLVFDKNVIPIQDVDQLLKYYAGIEKSTKDMTKEELQLLIEQSFIFAREIGLELDYPEDAIDLQLDLNIK